MPTDPATVERPGSRAAVVALLLACVFWGCGFTWAKAAGEAINRAAAAIAGSRAGGPVEGAALGPVLLLAFRFLAGAAVWVIVFPAARRGWSWRSLGRSVFLGSLLGSALIVQHLGLDRTSESVSAFLTSLTVLFVPLITTVAVRRRPRAALWAGVGLAVPGIWMLTGAGRVPAGWGEALGLLCSIVYSVHILCVNLVVPKDDPWRMTAGQFTTVGVMCLGTCLFLPAPGGGSERSIESAPSGLPLRAPRRAPVVAARGDPQEPRTAGEPSSTLSIVRILSLSVAPGVPSNLALLVVFPTLFAFGSLTHFQPRLDPTRATLIYLMEPVFAAAFAWAASPRSPGFGPVEAAGALLILAANVVGELFGTSPRPAPAPRVEPAPARL